MSTTTNSDWFNVNGVWQINVGQQQVHIVPPQTSVGTCANCQQTTTLTHHDQLGRNWCSPCVVRQIEMESRKAAAVQAAARAAASLAWIGQAFATCPPPLRARLYKALAGVFHPDVGGSVEAMAAINAARDSHCSAS